MLYEMTVTKIFNYFLCLLDGVHTRTVLTVAFYIMIYKGWIVWYYL
jgi:hypothetical protein